MLTWNSVPAIRLALDQAEAQFLATRREQLLRRIGTAVAGLLVWHFGVGGRSHDPREIPIHEIERYARHYALVSA